MAGLRLTRVKVLPVDEWLASVGAKHLSGDRLSNGDYLNRYALRGGRLLLVITYAGGNGWDVFGALDESNRVDNTMTALDRYLDAHI